MTMVDREKVVAVLAKRFPSAPPGDVAAAANAIVGLEPEFVPVPAAEVRRFDCECERRVFSMRHVTNGDVRMFYRPVRS